MQPTLAEHIAKREALLEKRANPPKFYRMPRRTPKRAKEDRQYNARVKVWLELPENRWCGVWLTRRGLTWQDVDENGFAQWWDDGAWATAKCPRATQCHHINKRTGPRLLDEKFWLGVSAGGHEWIERNYRGAREIGVLL